MNEKQRDLLKKVLDQVEREPVSLQMGTFESLDNHYRVDWQNDDALVEGCGTTRCVAGWVIHFKSRPWESNYAARRRLAWELGIVSLSSGDIAQEILGLDDRTAERVFFQSTEVEAVAWLRRQVAEPADTA